jgi:glycosyltransferase involved in cell wall biosynthesis
MSATRGKLLSHCRSTVVITTKNRKDELRVALRSAFEQIAEPEVVVMDDGSTDGTAEMVRAEFPKALVHHFNESKGLIVRRNEGARLATGDVVFSIDDDAEFSTPQVVEQTLREFDDARIGAVAIPYIEPHKGNRLMQQAPDRECAWITDRFVGTAHALRRDIFLKLGGYHGHLVHQGEEGDFCLRLLAAGYVVRLGNADPICHNESPKRDYRRMDFYGRRNDILFAWHNVPLPWLLMHLGMTTFNGLRAGIETRHPLRMLRGTLSGYAGCWKYRRERKPVPSSIYLLHRRLKKRGPVALEFIEPMLPALSHDSAVPAGNKSAAS